MSIIFEALKKIEEEKGDETPLVFAVPEEQGLRVARPRPLRRLLFCAAIGIPLAAIAILLIRPDWMGVSPGHRSAPVASPSLPPPNPVLKEVRVQSKSILPFSTDSSTMPKDSHFRAGSPSVETEIKLPDLRLKGISHGNRRSWAFINDKMKKAGDRIEGAEIIEIIGDRVKLKYKGVEFTLTY